MTLQSATNQPQNEQNEQTGVIERVSEREKKQDELYGCVNKRCIKTKTHNHVVTKPSKMTPKGQREDSVPDEESEDFRAKDQPSGVIDAQCGRRSSTGFRNFRP